MEKLSRSRINEYNSARLGEGFGFESDVYVAFISLKSALESFFNIYRLFRIYDYEKLDPSEYENNIDYYSVYSDTIIHLHHFFELIIKDLLQQEHPMLVFRFDRAVTAPQLLDIFNGKKVTSDLDEDIFTIEFVRSLRYVVDLYRSDSEKYCKYKVFKEAQSQLKYLNVLRNNMWHQGSYVLTIKDFTEFIQSYIFPVISVVSKMERYSVIDFWKPVISYKRVNVFECLIEKENYNEFNLLLELGRASYQNSFRSNLLNRCNQNENIKNKLKIFSTDVKQFYEDYKAGRDAKILSRAKNLNLTECPVCGIKALMPDSSFSSDRGGCSKVKCDFCSFEIYDDICLESNLFGIERFW
ncbi:MAG: hypothetical protein JXR63_10520 [Spirochaetales bacterium]|nr:hypothetical protein [Spirochaetales bacterium]